MKDPPVAVDFLKQIEKHIGQFLDLELCKDLLPILHELVTSRFESYVQVSMRYLKLLLRAFSHVIKGARVAAGRSRGAVDLALEDKLGRCNDCYEGFKSIYPNVCVVSKRQKSLGVLGREVRVLMENLMHGDK